LSTPPAGDLRLAAVAGTAGARAAAEAARPEDLQPARTRGECIGKGKPHKPYEFGVKVSLATPLRRCKGGQFIAHAAALPGNPYDGHTLAAVVPAIEQQIGVSLTRLIADKGYRGHNAPTVRRRSVFISGQKRGHTAVIRRQLRRRARTTRRCHQRHPGSRRIQLPPPAREAGSFLVPPVDRQRQIGSSRYPRQQLCIIFFRPLVQRSSRTTC